MTGDQKRGQETAVAVPEFLADRIDVVGPGNRVVRDRTQLTILLAGDQVRGKFPVVAGLGQVEAHFDAGVNAPSAEIRFQVSVAAVATGEHTEGEPVPVVTGESPPPFHRPSRGGSLPEVVQGTQQRRRRSGPSDTSFDGHAREQFTAEIEAHALLVQPVVDEPVEGVPLRGQREVGRAREGVGGEDTVAGQGKPFRFRFTADQAECGGPGQQRRFDDVGVGMDLDIERTPDLGEGKPFGYRG